jgi:uncharacterized protein
MQIDWFGFTPGPALLGGVMLGLAAALFLLLHGRILGISGIVSGLIKPRSNDLIWRICVILGLITAPFWGALLFDLHPVTVVDANWRMIIVAGFLVGFGSHYGSGCTSGHGICGLSRLSPRSFLATATFMFSGMVTVYLIRHVIGL